MKRQLFFLAPLKYGSICFWVGGAVLFTPVYSRLAGTTGSPLAWSAKAPSPGSIPSASALVLLLTMAVVEFVLVSFIAPALPGAVPLPTPTLNFWLRRRSLCQPRYRQPVGNARLPPPRLIYQTLLRSPPEAVSRARSPSPCPKTARRSAVLYRWSARPTSPISGFINSRSSGPDETIWLTIQAGNTPVQGGKLGDWDTTACRRGNISSVWWSWITRRRPPALRYPVARGRGPSKRLPARRRGA